MLVARVQAPHRFRSKRQFWAYCGLGLETRSRSGGPGFVLLFVGYVVMNANRDYPPPPYKLTVSTYIVSFLPATGLHFILTFLPACCFTVSWLAIFMTRS